MNKNILKKAILIATSLWACQSIAVGFTVPNTFVSGTSASATEVNANFEAIETGIDNNSNSINTNITDINTNAANIAALSGGGAPAVQLKDANGVAVGRIIGMNRNSLAHIVTDKGYRTELSIRDGRVGLMQQAYYKSTDCTGAAYVAKDITINYQDINGMVYVLHAYPLDSPLYVPFSEPGEVINAESYEFMSAGSPLCRQRTQTKDVYIGYQNDPTVTGIENTAYPARMKIE